MIGPQRIIPPPPPGWTSWEAAMTQALEEAERAASRGEVPVGALLLSGHGQVLARCGNEVEERRDPTAHAEILALRRAAEKAGNQRLEGAFLIVTLEPCAMCAAAAVHARIAGLVYGADDERAGAVQSRLDLLDHSFHNHKVWHMGGILAEDCATLLRNFFDRRRWVEANSPIAKINATHYIKNV
ncbi:tRNA adenosine(34) deaminase TadA [Desulfovibrio sp. OttesenSCG-928-M16]|nr:tRNA adenosine(34) deaminase TadA [Desulfovibrio sp. OttesenSCG-928-M16]